MRDPFPLLTEDGTPQGKPKNQLGARRGHAWPLYYVLTLFTGTPQDPEGNPGPDRDTPVVAL